MRISSILGLFLTGVFGMVKVAQAAESLPQFHTGGSKSYYLEVSPDSSDSNRLRIWISEYGNYSTSFTMQMKSAGFGVENGDTIEFLIPAKACIFKDRFLIHCDSQKLSQTEQMTMEMSVHQAGTLGGPLLRFRGQDLAKEGFKVSLSTTMTETSVLTYEGQVIKERTLGLKSYVWIYSSASLEGWFSHNIDGLRRFD